jgi:hypothetical protein
MKDWYKLKPELFKKQPYYLPGCDTYPISIPKEAVLIQVGATAGPRQQ